MLLLASISWYPVIPEGTPLWLWLLCVVSAVLVIGIAKSGFGGGIAVVAPPLFAVAMPTDHAVGILLPVLLAADVFAAVQHYRKGLYKLLLWMWAGAIVGVLAGTGVIYMLGHAGVLERALNLIVGATCLMFVGLQFYRMAGKNIHGIPTGRNGGVIAGAAAGIVSTIAHSAGPIITVYLLERKEHKAAFVGTMVMFFFILNIMKLPPYFSLGLIHLETMVASLWLLPVVPLGAMLGLWMYKRVAEKPFNVIMYIAAAVAAIHMIYKGVI